MSDPIQTAWGNLTSAADRMAKIKHHLSLGYPVPAMWVEWLLTKVAA